MLFNRKRDRMSSKKTRQNSTDKKPTLEMLIDLTRVVMGVLARLSFEKVNVLLGNKTLLSKKLEKVFEIAADPFAAVRTEWEKFYLDHCNIVVDFSEVTIPTKPSEGSWRLIFVSQGLTMNVILAVMRAKFKAWVYAEDLDGNVPTNTRTSVQSYAKWVRDGVEPDEEYLGKTTRDADMTGTIGMTLLERLVLGVKHFVETGKHLDIKGWTICTGSRYSDGSVPFVYWGPSTAEVKVNWCSVGSSNPTCGLRQAV